MNTSTKLNVSWAGSPSLLCLLTLALAQALPAQQNKISIAPSDPLAVKRGEPAKQVLKAVILQGFHVNSDKPKDEFLIPLKLTWDAAGPLEAKSISYPQPEEMELNGQQMLVYTGTVPIETEFVASKDAPKGPATITGKLKYQACNSHMCFRPATLDVHFAAVIE
jgi:DsbC/DsbD-like thiol-disulfide interchange protein